MKLIVHVREKAITIPVGDGPQKVKWLGHVAIARYEPPSGTELGVPKLIKTENAVLEMTDIIKDVLEDGAHVWITTSADDLPSTGTTARGTTSGNQ